jgi:hypothetical protein
MAAAGPKIRNEDMFLQTITGRDSVRQSRAARAHFSAQMAAFHPAQSFRDAALMR